MALLAARIVCRQCRRSARGDGSAATAEPVLRSRTLLRHYGIRRSRAGHAKGGFRKSAGLGHIDRIGVGEEGGTSQFVNQAMEALYDPAESSSSAFLFVMHQPRISAMDYHRASLKR